MRVLVPAVINMSLLYLSINELASSVMADWTLESFSQLNQRTHEQHESNINYISPSEKLPKFRRFKWNNIKQNDFGDNISTWLNPIEGYLAAHSTPIHLIKFKHSSIDRKIETHKLGKYLEDMYKILGNATVDSFIDNIRKKKYENYNVPSTLKSQQYDDSNIIYPEILVVIGYDFYKLFNKNMIELLTYVLAFWNGVDMRFRNLAMPKIRLNIAGIVIDEVGDIIKHRMSGVSYTINAVETLENVRSYLFKVNSSIPIDSYDIIVQMTSVLLCDNENNKKGACIPFVGVSRRGRSCFPNTVHKHMISTAVIRDKGYFNGITTAAHELGHIMGIHHDGEKPNVKCSSDRNYIMTGSGRGISENNSKWSQCSLNNLREFLNSKGAFCLYNTPPNRGLIAKRFLPGKVMDLNTQCKKSQGIHAIAEDIENCISLKCSEINRNFIYTQKTISKGSISNDGRSCGHEKFCLLNKCISEHKIH